MASRHAKLEEIYGKTTNEWSANRAKLIFFVVVDFSGFFFKQIFKKACVHYGKNIYKYTKRMVVEGDFKNG